MVPLSVVQSVIRQWGVYMGSCVRVPRWFLLASVHACKIKKLPSCDLRINKT